jgi:hypothetical protein
MRERKEYGMAILVTMQVGPVDWEKFKTATAQAERTPATGRRS